MTPVSLSKLSQAFIGGSARSRALKDIFPRCFDLAGHLERPHLVALQAAMEEINLPEDGELLRKFASLVLDCNRRLVITEKDLKRALTDAKLAESGIPRKLAQSRALLTEMQSNVNAEMAELLADLAVCFDEALWESFNLSHLRRYVVLWGFR